MRTEDIGIRSNNDKKTWWYVDLGGVYNVYTISILFRDYPGESKYVCPFVVTVNFISLQSKANLYIFCVNLNFAFIHVLYLLTFG